MKKLNAVVIDDEVNARAALMGVVSANFPDIEFVGQAKNLPEGIKLIRKVNPDIVFLDVEMPEFSGLEILDFFDIKDINFHLVFVTAYDKFALDAFELSATDYIVKPVQVSDIERLLNKIAKLKPVNEEVKSVQNNNHQKIILNANGGQVFVDANDIIYIRADGSYSDVILAGDKRLCISKRLAEFEKLMSMNNFFRIHRSHIINLNHITKISKVDGGSVFMSDGVELSISKDKKTELENKLDHLRI